MAWTIIGILISWTLPYLAGYMRGRRLGVDRGYQDAKDALAQHDANYWPKDPPPTLRYSGKAHLENDCGGCATYVLVNKKAAP
jgi:hypothetical protein